MVFNVFTVAISYLVLFMCCLLTNPDLRYAGRIRESTSDKQRMKVFSVLALSKQRSKMVEASSFRVASAIMALVIFIG